LPKYLFTWIDKICFPHYIDKSLTGLTKSFSYHTIDEIPLHYLDEVVLLSSAGVSSRLKEPRSALAGARAGLLLLFRVEEEERKLDSAHAPQKGKHWVIISQVC
jgi:hypothetical protein